MGCGCCPCESHGPSSKAGPRHALSRTSRSVTLSCHLVATSVIPVIHNSGAQVTEGLANLTDTISLSREASEDVTLVLDQTSDQPGHHCQQCQTHISAHLTKIPDLRLLLILFALPRDLVLAWDSLPEFPT